jgi:hypothetical protein
MLTVPRSSIGVKLLDISAFAAATIAASAIAIVGAFAPFLIGASALATTTASLPIASAALGNEARRHSSAKRLRVRHDHKGVCAPSECARTVVLAACCAALYRELRVPIVQESVCDRRSTCRVRE